MHLITNEREISPHWLPKIFGSKPAFFNMMENHVFVDTGQGQQWTVLNQSLCNLNALHHGIFFSKITLATSDGAKKLTGLRKCDADKLFHWLRAYWYEQIAPEIAQAADTIRSILSLGYPRESRVQKIQSIAQSSFQKFKIIPEPGWCPNLETASFELVALYALRVTSDWDIYKEEYLLNQLKQFETYFDNVETKPLTINQRIACVTDEDNNLVLAGAGTGKTSVIVSRAGYLLESIKAEPANILLLSFGKKAAQEMKERLKSRIENTEIFVSTFHKLGKEIISHVEGRQPSISPLAEDGRLLVKTVDLWFQKHLENEHYKNLALKYFQFYLHPDKNPFEFKSEGEYFDYMRANDIRTLKGELVKSIGECLIANHLFKSGIIYKYEEPYKHDTASTIYGQYKPDFYLPQLDIYIEYFGIDRKGNTPSYINKNEYHEGIAWKRKIHSKKGTQLIELFHYENTEGTLFRSIDEKLAKPNIKCEPLQPDQMLKSLKDFGAVKKFSGLLSEMLRLYKANHNRPGHLNTIIDLSEKPKQCKAAIELLLPIIDDYQTHLQSTGQIDFDDMIGKATHYIQQGKFVSPWKFILVDEFQDISEPGARLVSAIKNSSPTCSLFCVGDDWQSIYHFAGSDLSFTTNFKNIFGATAITKLDKMFRFDDAINNVTTKFVVQNPVQIKKKPESVRKVQKPSISLLRKEQLPTSNSHADHRIETVVERISALSISTLSKSDSTVYFLNRYGYQLPDKTALAYLSKKYPHLHFASHTMHGSKGKEADYVIISGLEKGRDGFPSEKATHPLLKALLPPMEKFKHAEERRLFYVALTRARHRVYLIADMQKASDFIVELLEGDYFLELQEFETPLSQSKFRLINCTKCKTGTLQLRKHQYGTFYGCNNYPLCAHKERGCQNCSNVMQRIGRYKICVNPKCGGWVPFCPACGAEMAPRKGKFGSFWGCRNYRKKGHSCKHTEKSIESPIYMAP